LLITDARHFDLLSRAQQSLESSARLLRERASEELVLVGLYNALRFLGEITGETTPEDVLSQIFATFCIGK
jgi:tRNA modification GTPase